MPKRKSVQYDMTPAPRESGSHLVHQVQQTSPLAATLFGGVFMIPGIYVLLLGLNVIHATPGSVHAPLFVLIGIGLAFSCAGLSSILQGIGLQRSWLGQIVGLGALIGMVTPFLWMAFFNDQITGFPKIMLIGLIGFFLFIMFLILFARFIPGVRVISGDSGESLQSIASRNRQP
jgi:hypothetical protein